MQALLFGVHTPLTAFGIALPCLSHYRVHPEGASAGSDHLRADAVPRGGDRPGAGRLLSA
jgi:hypothetical protein